MNTWALNDGWTLIVENNPLEVTSNLPRPDPNWRFVDANGHAHTIESLVWVDDETYWCEDCEDDHAEGHWECPRCHEHITPGTRGPNMFREFIPGTVHTYLAGPSGEHIDLPTPFTQTDVDRALRNPNLP